MLVLYEVVCISEILVLSQFTPIWAAVMLPQGKDLGFKIWASKGESKIDDLFTNAIFMSYEDLIQKYYIQTKHFF